MGKMITALFAALMLAFAVPAAAAAAQIEFTANLKSSLDSTIAGADSAQANQIRSLYNELLALQQQEQNLDEQTNSLHSGNTETLDALRKQIKQIDAAKLDGLKADVTQTEERYKPLLAFYSSLNKQIVTARMLNNSTLGTMLRIQAGALKPAVQLARKDIRLKKQAWQAAADDAAKSAKKIRSVLSDIDPVSSQIKAKQSGIRTAETGFPPVWSTFKQAVKQRDAKNTTAALSALVSLSRQIRDEKQKVLSLETKISEILSAAKAQMSHFGSQGEWLP